MSLTPYYEHGGIVIYHGDCLDILPSVSGDVAVTDPPYNVGLKYTDATEDTRKDYRRWCAAWFYRLRAAVKTVALTPGTPNVHQWLDLEEPDLWLCNWRPNGAGYSKAGFCHWEPMLVWGPVLGKRGTDVIRAPIIRIPEAEPHPCPKPLAWAEGAIRLLSPEGGTVIDPFLGSGTTAIASYRLGMKCIGIDAEERYCEIAARRLQQEVLPLEATA